MCTKDNLQPLRPVVPTPDDNYELVSENHVFLSARGKHMFHFTGSLKNNASVVHKGDILGFSSPANGYAELASRESSKSELFHPEEFAYEGAVSLGDVLSTSEPSTNKSETQHSVIAFYQVPSQLILQHSFPIGVYSGEITVKGSHSVLSANAYIVSSQSITGVNWTYPQAVPTNGTFDIIVHPHPGYNVTYVMWYGGDNLTDFKTQLDADLPFSYSFTRRGQYGVSLMASNVITFRHKACSIIVQDLIKNLSFYTPIAPTALNNVTTVDWLMRQGSSVNITVDFGDGTILNEGYFDVSHIWVASNTHQYAEIGEYPVLINISNLVSNASIQGLAVVEVPLEGVSFEVVHSARDIEVNETVTVQISVAKGTNPEFLVDFGDGNIVTTRELTAEHSYTVWKFYNVSIWAYNNVSNVNVTREIQVHKPVEVLVGFNITCPPTNLTYITPCMLNITKGTDFKCTWLWGDGLQNETTFGELGNLTFHTYSSIGHHQVTINCTNRLYNTTAETIAIVEKPILNFTVNHPGARRYDQDFTVSWWTLMGTDAIFNISFTHVLIGTSTEIAITSLTADGTAGTALITTSAFPVIGIYELNVTAINHVTPLQVIILTVLVDIPIISPVLTRFHEHFVLRGSAPFQVTMTNGSNATLHWDFGDGINFSEFFIGEYPAVGTPMAHAYQNPGVFDVVLFGNNSVSNFTLRTYMIIQAPTDVLIFRSNSPQEIPPGNITFTVSLIQGKVPPTNATYTLHFGDGTVESDKELHLPQVVNHTYPTHGAYAVNVTIRNVISNVTLELEVELQTLITELKMFATHSKGDAGPGAPGRGPGQIYFPLDYPVIFTSNITNGTNVTYTWHFENRIVSTKDIIQVNHTFSEADTSIYVELEAENALGKESVIQMIKLEKIVKGIKFTNDGPTKLGKVTTFTLSMEQFGTSACYYVQLENGTTYLYKQVLTTCAEGCPTSDNVRIAESSPISMKHTYTTIGVQPVKVVGCNHVSKIEVLGEAASADKPCTYPNVTILPRTAGPNISAAKIYLKSESLTILAEIIINCEATDKTKLEWVICKLEEDKETCSPVPLPADLTVNSRELRLPRRSLRYGHYVFKFTVTMLGVEGIYTTAQGYVSISKSQITAKIAGGTTKAVGYGKSIILDAGESIDPDLEPGNYTGMHFSWFCAKKEEKLVIFPNSTSLPGLPLLARPFEGISNMTNASAVNRTSAHNESSGCLGYGPGRLNTSERQFTFDTSRTKIEGYYEVTVLIKKDSRIAMAIITLIVKEGDPPDVMIT